MRSIKSIVIAVTIFMVTALTLISYSIKLSPLSWQLHGVVNTDAGLALKGYDPVAYFHDGKAVKGNPSISLQLDTTTWYFSSEMSRQKFKTHPDKYKPQFGGFCARAVASGFTADIDPGLWDIENGKLYLFYDEGARNSFISEINEGIISNAETGWSEYQKR